MPALFAASPLLLLLVGGLSRAGVSADVRGVVQGGDWGGDGGGDGGGEWMVSGAESQGEVPPYQGGPQPRRRRRLQAFDVAVGVVLSESTVSVSEGGSNATYTVVLDADPITPLNVNLANGASSEVTTSTSSLGFTTTNWDTEQRVTVTAVDDGEVEALSEVAITHSVAIPNGTYTWTGAFSPSASLTARVYDNDEAGVLLSTSTLYVDEGDFSVYTVKLMGSPSEDVQVTASANSAYLTVSTNMPLTFTTESWNQAQTITITGAEDAIQTAESYTAAISHTVASTDTLFDGDSVLFFPSSEVSVVIYDNDDGCYRSCAAGEWASPCNGTFECASCSPGYYCSGDCSDPIACPVGTAVAGYGSSVIGDCAGCLDGYYATEEGTAACSACPAGYSCSSASATPTPCAKGEYSSAGSIECTACADGYYSAFAAQEFCLPCPAGYECSDATTEPSECSPGSYSYGNATVCEDCPAGYYCSSTGSSPEVCQDGSYSLGNWAYCVVCPPGHYCINTNEVPTICSAGTTSLGGSTSCTPCASGTYASVEGTTGCTNCPAGSSCLNVTAEPVACTNGTYSQLGNALCTNCDAGTYSFGGASSCLSCPVGHSCFNPVSSPVECSDGYYSNGGNVLACSVCEPGTYTDSLHASCIVCPAGYECSDPTLGQVLCAEGYYSDAGDIACKECPAGSYCTSSFPLAQACGTGTYTTSGSANCTVCPGGFYCATPSDLPIACSDGEYSAEGASTCTPCPAGSYCPGPPRDEDSKAPCPAGQYSLGGTSSCSACPKGFYCPDASQGPTACPDGYYADVGNKTACDRCTAGNYCPSAAMPEQACPQGYYSLDGASSCTGCSPGFACSAAASTPVPCSPGTFSVALATNCTSCPPGYYCPNTQAAEFYECPAGTYSTGDASSCQACSPGFYCPLTTVAVELACPDGYYAGGSADNCTACAAGFACSSDGSSMVACELGYYSQAGATDCVSCPAGFYCPYTYSATIEECNEGTFSEGALSVCESCEAGYYCPYLDSAEARPCLSGSYSTGGKKICTDCPAGFMCSSTATADMDPCGEGYYSLLGDPTCTACPAGYRCPQTDNDPISCDPGYYSTSASVNCTSCPAGYFCDDPEASPQPCEVGYYSGGGSSVCSACQPGYRCPEASVGATPTGSECPEGTYCNPARTLLECPAGTYGNVTAAASLEEGCQSCTEGYYCTDTGNTLATRKICPAGYYCPVGSSSPSACAPGLYNSLTGSWSNNDCAECAAGYYCTSGSSSSTSSVCPAGHYCPANTPSSTSYPCPAGSYSGNTGNKLSSDCVACTVGSYCPQGSTDPTRCSTGTYQPAGSATDVSACLACEPGWACPSTGMSEMTTQCGMGSYCPAGTSSREQYACDAGTYTDSTNLTSTNQCTMCPERKTCPLGSTSVDWSDCGAGYYCPAGTPSGTSYPCPSGSYSNRTDLAAASECYPCPLGFWCGGSGSDEPDGPCQAGYYCPLSTGSATDYPCPVGTFSNSTSLYRESQCQDCSPGYYCAEASTTTEPCPAGTYSPYNATQDAGPGAFPSCTSCPAGSYCEEASVEPVPCGKGLYSDEGADNCTVCEVGYYCGSNETTALAMLTGGGTWSSSSDDAGMCFNGTFCAAGMNRAPDLLRDSCVAGYYCPAGAVAPFACPSGTYNPHEGMDDESDCQTSPAGSYTIEASTNMTGLCAAGYYCPAGSTGPQQVPCPERYYRSSEGAASQDDCALCVSGGYCLSGSTEPTACPRGFYCVTGVSEAEPCPLGTYGNTTGLRKITDCNDCDPGYYCDQRGLTTPADLCDPGYFCLDGSYTSAPNAPGSPLSIDDSDIGGLCPAGGYCPIGSSYPQPCPAGTYNNFSGAADPADCSDCPPGFYCSGTSNPAPTGGCLSGFYCTGGANTSIQNVVEAGHYSTVGASQQYPCLPGTYNNEVGQDSCLDCLAGYYCPGTASTTVTSCPVGEYCPEGSDVPKLCPAGTYSPSQGLYNESQCIDCDPGKYCNSNGLTAITGSCEAGYYCTTRAVISNPIGQSYGDLCTAGHYCEEGSAWPEPCPIGTYHGAEGNDGDVWYNDTITGVPYRSYCTLCPATSACNSTGLSTPDVVCAAGYFCKLGAASPFPYCEAGEGLCDYGVCPAGHYCPTGTSDPFVCAPGTFMNNTGAAECFECPERYYCDGSTPRSYTDCPVGHYCPTGTGASYVDCPSGTFSAQTGLASASECTECTAGMYCASTGLTAPDAACSAGYYCPSGSQDANGANSTVAQHICPAGRYCAAGVGSPSLCPVGTYNPAEGIVAEEDCVACSSGEYCETTGLLSPTGPCSSGYYCKRGAAGPTPTTGTYTDDSLLKGGDICPVQYFCPNGTDTPIPCEAGTYNDLLGQDECFDCPPGFYCEANSSTYTDSPCPAGYYCLEGTRYANEYPCPPGTYANTTATTSLANCVDAPAGSYVAGSASLAISGSCDEGFYCSGGSSSATPFCNETADGTCETGGPCVAGQYCPAGSPYPQACPGGSYCAGSSGAITGECYEGHYCTQGSWTPAPQNASDANGEVGDVCPPGFYCEAGSVAPRGCPPSTYSPSTGNTNSSACLPCEPGFMCPNASTAVPTEPCPAGFYCPAGTAEATEQCGTGEACLASSWEPVACEAGTYQTLTGQESCMDCPERFYCASGTGNPTDCPVGSYCPAGTSLGTEYLCPPGTFGNAANLANSSECSACTPGSYCEEAGLSAPTGLCEEGYYCNGGATVKNPDSLSDEGYQGETCVDRVNATSNDLCPAAHFCPNGSAAPIPCPPGTSSATFGLKSESDCAPCEAGYYCPDNGAYNVTALCTEGFYCPGGDAFPTRACTRGHYCPAGSADPVDCVAGTYQNDTGASDCDICPARHYCEATTTNATLCPAGYFCPEGTEFATEFPCHNGTYSNETGLAAATECTLCPPGRYCGSEGLHEFEGLCGAGYYCALGATSPVPEDETDASVAGLCAGGYACVEGAESPQPVDGITGYDCPQGTYCPAGSSFPIGCSPGTYNPSRAMESCPECPAGSVCAGNTTTPEACPVYQYCPAGSAAGIQCPGGTYGSRTDLQAESECSPCPAGHYCIDGNITSTCRAGYFCKTGADNAVPNSVYANYSYELYNDVWEALDAGPCPAGHYCSSGTEDPKQCLNASVRVSLLGVSADDCGVCPAGYVCFPGDPIPEQCYRGYYCPQGEDPIACPVNTYNPDLQKDHQDDCLSCPAGYHCFSEGIGDFTQYPCPAGQFCLTREGPTDCPAGTYRNSSGAAAVDDCHQCPGGFQCATGTVSPDVCPESTYCPTGASNTTVCPAGSYCPVETDQPTVCPKGYYCPLASSAPITCVLGTYCPEGAEIFTSCPLGWHGSLTSNNTVWSRDEACAECPPGTYGTDPDRLVCEPCTGGYVCLGTTSSATPTSIDEDMGFMCTVGHYCPEGSSEERTCSAGSYNSLTGSSSADACIVCAVDHYQDQAGSSTCLPCSSSSTSEANATECQCLGLNRAFQLSDGQCICRSGYEYYNEGGVLVSTVDGAIDCQPIVYERCYTGEALDADGDCLSESDCDVECGDTGGTFYEHIGLCECHGIQDLNAVCDVNCRDEAAVMFVDPVTGLIVIVEDNSTEYVDPADLPSFAGALYCSNDAGCSLFPVEVSTNFSGVYGTGNAVAAASASSSSTTTSSRRRRLNSVERHRERDEDIVVAVAPDDEEETNANGVRREGENGVVLHHRRGGGVGRRGGGRALGSESEMIQTFLLKRAENYRPRNQYRDRFFSADGTQTTIPGAIPKDQRLSPLPRNFDETSPLYEEEEEDDYDDEQYGPHPEEHAEEGQEEEEKEEEEEEEGQEEQAGRRRKEYNNRRGRRRRRLDGDGTGEPAVEHPLTCVTEGDAVLFDISSGCYPLYEKDSLLNSNLEFDYGEFRSVAELSRSSATYGSFGFVFENAGTYVFSSSCNSMSIVVVAVMSADVSCTTDAYFVPLTAANLIKLGVAKNSDDITLTPDWALIGGLLAGVAFMIFGVVSAVYYFRTKAWATGQAPIPAYRTKARGDRLEGVDQDSRQGPGFFSRRPNRVLPEFKTGGDKPGRSLRSRMSISGRVRREDGGGGGGGPDDLEMQDKLDSFGGEDDPNIRELVERMQKYHDEVEQEFTGQKELVLKLHHLLEQEADELKRLLGAKAGVVGEQPAEVADNAARATCARLKRDMASRRLHEANVSTSEVEALSALKRLQEHLQEGAGPFAKRVLLEISSPEFADASHDDANASTPLLHEIQDIAELIRAEVVDEMSESIERERVRGHDARMLLEGAVSKGGVVLPEEVMRTLKTTSELDARTDAGERGVTSTLKRLADRLPACTQELRTSEGLILRNLTRIRAMGNTSLEDAERQRGEQAISTVVEQLVQALAVVGDRANAEKVALDAARSEAEAERHHLEEAVQETIKTLSPEGDMAAGHRPSATADDLQGMFKQIQTLVTSSASSAAAPADAASALLSQIAASEYRRQSIEHGGGGGSVADLSDREALRAEEEAEEMARRSLVEATLLKEQEAGVAAVVAVAETQKKNLEEELDQAGATVEEKKAMMGALADDQRAIESVLEGERIRVEENLRTATAARKAREDMHAEEDAAEESRTKAELLHQQTAQIRELRRKHEEAQVAVAEEVANVSDDEDSEEEMDKDDTSDKAGMVKTLKKAHAEQSAMLEASLDAKGKCAQKGLWEKLRAQRANLEAGFVQKGASAPSAAMQADKELAPKEAAAQEELTAKLAAERKRALRAESVAQRKLRRAVRNAKYATDAAADVDKEVQRIRKEAADAIAALEKTMTEQGKARHRALADRLKAKRQAREAELKRRGAGESEMCEQDADLTRMEELETEALEEKIQVERGSALRGVRKCAAAAENMAVVANNCAGGADIDPSAEISTRRMKELHLAAMERLEHDLNKNEKNANRALRERLMAARAAREETLQAQQSLPAAEAAKRARHELEAEEDKAKAALAEELANDRLETIGRAKLEMSASLEGEAGISMQEEAKRLLAEHRERTKELREAMEVDAKRQKAKLQKRLASLRRATDQIVVAAQSVSPAAASKATALAEAAEQAEKNALDRDLLGEASRFESDAEAYERSVQDILASAEADAASAAATVETPVPGGEPGTPRGPAPGKALWAAAAAHTKDNKELLRRVHERGIAAMELQNDSNKRAAAGRLAQRRAAARAARTEAMKAAGKSQEEITAENIKEDELTAKESAEQEASLGVSGLADLKEEQDLQVAATVNEVDPAKEAARIRERHARCMAEHEKELEEHHRDQRAALSSRLRKRRSAKQEALRKDGAEEEEVAAAMKAMDFEDERDTIQLEGALLSLKEAEAASASQAAAVASGEDEHPEAALADLRARHQEGEVLLKKSLRAEAGSRRMRMHQRIANRVSERARQLREKGSSKEEIEVETTAIRAAGKAEEERIEAVHATESEARVHSSRLTALTEEAALETRQEEKRELRERHEQAVGILNAEMKEKKRLGWEGVAKKVQARKTKRMAELEAANASSKEVADELVRLDEERRKEGLQIEAAIDKESAMLAEAQQKMLTKREAEARETQLTADNSARATEAEIERIRREHEVHQRGFTDAQENKRRLRYRALEAKLARRREERMRALAAALASAAEKDKCSAELDEEEIKAYAALDEELIKEMCNAIEADCQSQARAETAARAAAEVAIVQAEQRARVTKEEYELSTKRLDEQLALAKVAQGKKLQERLAKKRDEREAQLAREGADPATILAARRKLKTEGARETAKLENHLKKERERLHAENLVRAVAKRAQDESDIRDKAAEDANAAVKAQKDADGFLRQLQQQHEEQYSALENQMGEERRSREGKLRDRLEKKRGAKQEEIKKAALSAEEQQRQRKYLEDDEAAERQKFEEQLEEERVNRIEAQRKSQEEAMAAATAEAAEAAEMAAVAAARAAAAEAVRVAAEAAELAEQEQYKRKAQKLKDLSKANENKAKLALAGSSAANKAKLAERLAKKKARAEAMKREMEAAQRREEEKLLAKHKEEAEAAKAAEAPGWSGDVAWDEAVRVAMAEPPRDGETAFMREARVLKSVLEADIVPENKIGKCVELVMSGRHEKETSDLLTAQYKERASRLVDSLGALLAEKTKARTEVLQRLAKTNASAEEKAEAASGVDDEFAGRQQQLETKTIQEMEPAHLEKQLELRQRQLREVAGTVKSIAPESALKRFQEIAASKQEEELEKYRIAMEREKEDRLKRVEEERARFEQDLRARHEAEMQRLQAEEDKLMDAEREAQEARMIDKKAELGRQRAEEQRKAEENSGKLDAKEKEALLEQFKRDQVADLDALKAEEASQKSKLEQKLNARRQKKTQELRQREEKELRNKQTRDAKALQEFEKQAEIEAKAEAAALSASAAAIGEKTNLGGLKVDIDQEAIQLAREAGGPNEAKERLKQTIAASETRKITQRRASLLSAAGGGRMSMSPGGSGATAAAAAAAAAAATSTAYGHISKKLEGIEALIAALKAAQGDRHTPESASEVYRDAEDAATVPEGSDLQVVPRASLPVQAIARLDFGEHLLSVLGLGDTVKLQVAKNLPPALLPGGTNANAFRNSYLWQVDKGVLHIHVRRLSSSGDFGLVLVHAAAHIQVDPYDMSNDLDPRFTRHFHGALKVLTQELFKHRGAAAADGEDKARSSQRTPGSPGGGDKTESGLRIPPRMGTTSKTGRAAEGAGEAGVGGGGGEFAHDALAERMERYARASGHPRLVEMLSRHKKDQKDKFTLSDDEDQASNVDDTGYMETFDNRDGEAIFRSPIGSVMGRSPINSRQESNDTASPPFSPARRGPGKEETKG